MSIYKYSRQLENKQSCIDFFVILRSKICVKYGVESVRENSFLCGNNKFKNKFRYNIQYKFSLAYGSQNHTPTLYRFTYYLSLSWAKRLVASCYHKSQYLTFGFFWIKVAECFNKCSTIKYHTYLICSYIFGSYLAALLQRKPRQNSILNRFSPGVHCDVHYINTFF